MKKAIVYALVLLSIVICSFKTSTSNGRTARNDDQMVRVVFNNQMTFDELVKIKNDLHAKHIDLTYKMIGFDEDNHLSKIDFKVDCNDGFKGGAGADHLTSRSAFGFYRDYTKNAASPFGTGAIDDAKK